MFSSQYRKCQGIGHSFDATVVFSCLGDWYVGGNHYFTVVNTRESRKEEKYRCFVRNREDDLYMGHSITPECSVLKTPENSPVRFRLSYVKHEEVSPGCFLPRNLTGKWQSTGKEPRCWSTPPISRRQPGGGLGQDLLLRVSPASW
ncbi:uncharacterized protein LOC121878342 [Homarus americanus]|uniref:uncharacterized protein LOC121878342 n=1 Tax=Homarus americanus TaxID=6706 RepID=UPI001C47A094|nr:uncharacterized protein LOC121878342 [Homarus americanus]